MKLEFKLRGVVFLGVNTCIDIRNSTSTDTQGKTMFLWHRENKKISHDIPNKWVIYKRDKYDMSHTGDKDGLSRWVAAHAFVHDQREYKKL
jgi:hypothetical protein